MNPTAQFKIESGIPIPTPHNARKHPVFPFESLVEIGQSFFVPVAEPTDRKRMGRILNTRIFTYYKLTSHKGRKFAVRAVDGGVRVWRVS